MLTEVLTQDDPERHQNYDGLNLLESDNVKCRTGLMNAVGKVKECPVLNHSCDKLELVEDRTRVNRQSLRTSLGDRVLRNRRYRSPFDDHRHSKRLFTPEIKKYLKDWLIRRRDHPYPNREEKRNLAVQTGLTYIQICNWFANWRRKLKNAGSEEQRTWSHLIKSYNTKAEGNVEQFSISSNDSIWERREYIDADEMDDDEDEEILEPSYTTNPTAMDHSYSVSYETHNGECDSVNNVVAEEIVVSASIENQPQCFTVSSTTTEDEEAHTSKITPPETSSQESGGRSNKYKRHIMEKYMEGHLRQDFPKIDITEKKSFKRNVSKQKRKRQQRESDANGNSIITYEWEKQQFNDSVRVKVTSRHEKKSSSGKGKEMGPPPKMLSKWLESAAKFQPTKSYVPWTVNKNINWPKKSRRASVLATKQGELKAATPASSSYWEAKGHQRAELDAAEALTCLSGLHQ